MACYWDTSALLSLLFQEEPGSQKARSAAQRGGLPGYTSFFTLIEMESAYARRISDGSFKKDLLPELRLRAQRLEAALGLVWADAEVTDESKRLVLEMGLRPADALQAASALLVLRQQPKVTFASLDARLNRAAEAVGLSLAW